MFAALIGTDQLNQAENGLLASLKDYPDDRTLHLMLADVYRRMHLPVAQRRELKAAGVE